MGRSKKKGSDTREPIDYPIDQIERLGLLIDELELEEIASSAQLEKRFPIKARGRQKLPADFIAEKDIVEASPMPLSREARTVLIRASTQRSSTRKAK